jgi:hypothetical protein
MHTLISPAFVFPALMVLAVIGCYILWLSGKYNRGQSTLSADRAREITRNAYVAVDQLEAIRANDLYERSQY